MAPMQENEAHQEDNKEMTDMNIQEFIAATRQYLFEQAATTAQRTTIAQVR